LKNSALTSIYIPYFYIEPFSSSFRTYYRNYYRYFNYRGAIFVETIVLTGPQIIYEGARK